MRIAGPFPWSSAPTGAILYADPPAPPPNTPANPTPPPPGNPAPPTIGPGDTIVMPIMPEWPLDPDLVPRGLPPGTCYNPNPNIPGATDFWLPNGDVVTVYQQDGVWHSVISRGAGNMTGRP